MIIEHFGVGKTIVNLQRYFYWPHIFSNVSHFIRGCSLCATGNPINSKLGLYTPLLVPSRPWESISMDFVGGLPLSRKGHDYLYVFVDMLSKMGILTPCKNQITTEQRTHLFFQNIWVHFGLPTLIVSDCDFQFVGNFWSNLWDMTDTKLNKSTTFHSQIDGKTEMVNKKFIHHLSG